MFTPLDILYIVLAFCALWLTAAIFWMIWQVASMLRNVNEAVAETREVMHKVESALSGIRSKFDTAASSLGTVAQLAMKGVGYVLEKKGQMMEEMLDDEMDEPVPVKKTATKKKKK